MLGRSLRRRADWREHERRVVLLRSRLLHPGASPNRTARATHSPVSLASGRQAVGCCLLAAVHPRVDCSGSVREPRLPTESSPLIASGARSASRS